MGNSNTAEKPPNRNLYHFPSAYIIRAIIDNLEWIKAVQ